MKTYHLIAFAGSLALGGIALAADATFDAADTDGDGQLSAAEVAEAMPTATQEAFDAADADQSGTLSEAEFVAAVESGTLPRG